MTNSKTHTKLNNLTPLRATIAHQIFLTLRGRGGQTTTSICAVVDGSETTVRRTLRALQAMELVYRTEHPELLATSCWFVRPSEKMDAWINGRPKFPNSLDNADAGVLRAWRAVEPRATELELMRIAVQDVRGSYHLSLLDGSESWSGSSLRGKARKYSGKYARSRCSLVDKLNANTPAWYTVRTQLVFDGDSRRWTRRLVLEHRSGVVYLWR